MLLKNRNKIFNYNITYNNLTILFFIIKNILIITNLISLLISLFSYINLIRIIKISLLFNFYFLNY